MYSRAGILSKVYWNFPFMNLVSQGSQEKTFPLLRVLTVFSIEPSKNTKRTLDSTNRTIIDFWDNFFRQDWAAS